MPGFEPVTTESYWPSINVHWYLWNAQHTVYEYLYSVHMYLRTLYTSTCTYLRTLWVQIMFKEFCDIFNGYMNIGFLLIFLTVYWYLISNSCQFFAISLAQVYSDSLEFIWYLTPYLKYKLYIFLNFLTLPRSIYKFGNSTRTIFFT